MPLSLDLVYDHKLLQKYESSRKALCEFLKTEIAGTVGHFDKAEEFPEQNIRKFASRGYMGIPIPQEYEGAELGEFGYGLAIQEIGKTCSSHGTIIGAHTGLCSFRSGSSDLRSRRKSTLLI